MAIVFVRVASTQANDFSCRRVWCMWNCVHGVETHISVNNLFDVWAWEPGNLDTEAKWMTVQYILLRWCSKFSSSTICDSFMQVIGQGNWLTHITFSIQCTERVCIIHVTFCVFSLISHLFQSSGYYVACVHSLNAIYTTWFQILEGQLRHRFSLERRLLSQ